MTIEHQFPVETLTHVLKLLDIPSRVKLASCNLTLQQRVYRECFGAWISIDFSLPTHSVRLGDLDLSRLLTRVNARLVTKDLDLKSCNNVRGTGLAPLRSSRVLETVSLPGFPFDPTIVFWTLQTCIPYNLSHVSMNKYGKEYKADVTLDFMRKLAEEKAARALESGIPCSDCGEPLVEQSMQTVPGLRGLPTNVCLNCKKSYCRKASCPVGMLDCTDCHQTFCTECDKVLTCISAALRIARTVMKIIGGVIIAGRYVVTDATKLRCAATVKKRKSAKTAELRQMHAAILGAFSVGTVGKIRNALAASNIFAFIAHHPKAAVDAMLNIVTVVAISNLLLVEYVLPTQGFAATAPGLSTVLVAVYTYAKLTTVLLIASRVVSAIAVHVRL